MKRYQIKKPIDTPNVTLLQAAIDRARNELGRDVTPKDFAYYIGGEPSQWGRILKGAIPTSDYLYRLRCIEKNGIKYAAVNLMTNDSCPNKYMYSCEKCRRKICPNKPKRVEYLEKEKGVDLTKHHSYVNMILPFERHGDGCKDLSNCANCEHRKRCGKKYALYKGLTIVS
jgi:hypothetical protein